MLETAIGDGTILAGLFWLIVALTGLAIAAGFVVLMVVSAWKGFDLFAAADAIWTRIQALWQSISSRFKP